MITKSYIKAVEEEIEVGGRYYFGQFIDTEGNEEDILESGSISMYDEEEEDYVIVEFKIIELDEDNISDTVVEVTEIM